MNGLKPDLRAIFSEALDQKTPEDLAKFLDAACQGDADRRARLEALLAAHQDPGKFLGGTGGAPSASGPAATIDSLIPERLGTVIGRYKLLEEIGEGGMGTVWMAQQTEPVRRLVAVKLIKPGMDSKQVLARFEAERQALALMDHPNIAKVHDAGTTEPIADFRLQNADCQSEISNLQSAIGTGRPFFIMELVKGVPITKYCDEQRLTPRARLELFAPVCQAIQHAHQKGIIHRDVKPSNALVALYDDRPVPKVIDFGVAKATGQQLTEQSLHTGLGAVVGTLEYMSPEQAGFNQLDVDTRSDSYSLGVLLYELLTGSPPFSRKELETAGVLEMLRVIREQEPPKPSTKLSTADGLPTLAANRGTEPAKLTKLVRGELDWIVMKTLEKDRNRRYETANGFAMDVQRYLADEPVLACPPSVGYRLRKFVRRTKVSLAVAGLVLFFLVLLGSGVGWAVRDRAAQQAEFEHERTARQAEAEREKVEQQQRLTAQVELMLAGVDRLMEEQKWPEAMAAALAGGDADDSSRQRVRDLRRDLEFVARLDRIRQDRATLVEGQFNYRGAVRDYGQAFRDYGVDVEDLPPKEAVARLQAKPALAVPLAAALDDWADMRRMLGESKPGRKQLIAVARGLDTDPLRDRLRASWGQPVTPEFQAELRRLAKSINVHAQPGDPSSPGQHPGPVGLAGFVDPDSASGTALHAKGLPEEAIVAWREAIRLKPD